MGLMGAALMARSKAQGQDDADRPKNKGGRPPVENPKRNVVTIRGSEEWRDWLNRFAEDARMPAVTLVDQALTHYAKHLGFDPPPKR